jgi:hypothetical protein
LPRLGLHIDNTSLFIQGSVVTLVENLVLGHDYGVTRCNEKMYSLRGTIVRIYDKTRHEGYWYYRIYKDANDTHGAVLSTYFREDLFVAPPTIHNVIDIDMVKEAYLICGRKPMRKRYFYGTTHADPLGAISLALGGDTLNGESTGWFLTHLFDVFYLKAFALGFDNSGDDRVSPQEHARMGYLDGIACYEALKVEQGGDF